MAQSALIKLDGNNDNLAFYGHHTKHSFLEDDELTSLESRLTQMVWRDDSSGLISLVKQCHDRDEDLDPGVAARLLQLACKLDSVSCARILIEGQTGAVVNVNKMDGFGRSPLHNAAEMLSVKCIDLLLQRHAQADIRSKDVDAFLPLEIALASQRIHVNWSPNESVEALLLSIKDMDLGAIRLLVKATKNLTEVSCMMAVEGQVIELAFLLLVAEDRVKGGSIIQEKNSLCSETYSIMYEFVLEELLKLLEIAKDGQHWKSIHRIYEKRRALLCQIELLHLFGGEDKKVLPLLRASEVGDELLVDVLLKQNVDVNETNEDGNSSLHCFLKGDASSQNPRILQNLLKHGAKVYKHNKLGLTPVHFASLRGNYEALKILLLHAPECVDILSVTNETPLFLAVKNNCINCVKLLLQFGASRDALNLRKQRPIDLALSEEMRGILRTVYPITLFDGNKLSQDDDASYLFDEDGNEDMLKPMILSKKFKANEMDEKMGICRYFHSPNGCGRGRKCHYFHGEEAQRLEKTGVLEFKPRVLIYNKGPASCFQDDFHRKIFVGGLPPSVDSVDLKKFFEEEFGPVEDAIVIGTKGGGCVLSKCYGFLTFKQEDAKKMAVKTHFINLSGKAIEIKSIVPKCWKSSEDLGEIKGSSVPSLVDSNHQQLAEVTELPPWVDTFKKWLPDYLKKACQRLGEGEWYPLSSLKGDFRATCGMELDHESIGFLKLSDFLRSLPGICRIHMISTGNGSPTHMVLQPPYSFPCIKPQSSKQLPLSPHSSSSSEAPSPTHSSSLSESILKDCIAVEKSSFLEGNSNHWMCQKDSANFLEYNLWKSVEVPKDDITAGKRTEEPFSFFVHQWDSGLLARGFCTICKKSVGASLNGVHLSKICHSCENNQLCKPDGYDEDFPSLGELGSTYHYNISSSFSHRNKAEHKNADISSSNFLISNTLRAETAVIAEF